MPIVAGALVRYKNQPRGRVFEVIAVVDETASLRVSERASMSVPLSVIEAVCRCALCGAHAAECEGVAACDCSKSLPLDAPRDLRSAGSATGLFIIGTLVSLFATKWALPGAPLYVRFLVSAAIGLGLATLVTLMLGFVLYLARRER